MDVNVYDFEISDEGELAWASLAFDGVNFSLTAFEEGLRIDLSVPKLPEGEDLLDQQAFYAAHNGKLPTNYWLQPARILKALLESIPH